MIRGISTLPFRKEDLKNNIKKLSYLNIELVHKRGHFYPQIHDDILRWRDRFSKYRINVVSLHTPYDDRVDIGDEDEWNRTRSLREIEKSIVIAHYLKSKSVVVHPGSDEDMSITLQSLKSLKEFADEFGIVLCLENMSPQKPGYLSEKFVDVVKSSGVKVCLDVGHLFLHKDDVSDLLKEIKDDIFYMHIHNNDGIVDRHWGINKGNFSVDEFFNYNVEMMILELQEKEGFDEEVDTFLNYNPISR